MKLLLVDSDPEVQEWVEANLTQDGFEVAAYGDGLSALDMIAVVDPDLVLASLNLSGMNIIRFCTKLRQKAGAKSIPIFLMVTPGSELDEPRLRSAGVTDFIPVPMKLEEVRAKLRPALPSQKPSEAPAASASPGPVTTSEDSVEGLKIEELLGWGAGPGKPGAESGPGVLSPSSSAEEERTVIADVAGLMSNVAQAVPAGTEAGSRETEDKTVVMRAPVGEEALFSEEKPAGSTENLLVSGSMAELNEMSPPPGEGIRESFPAAASPNQQAAEEAVNRMAREVIEKIAWEVVPTIAEALIKEELEKLKPK